NGGRERIAEDGIIAALADQRVIPDLDNWRSAAIADQGIAVAAELQIIAGSAPPGVVTRVAEQRIVAGDHRGKDAITAIALDGVVAGIAGNQVVATVADQHVVAWRAVDGFVTRSADVRKKESHFRIPFWFKDVPAGHSPGRNPDCRWCACCPRPRGTHHSSAP